MNDFTQANIGVVFWQEDAELNTLASNTCRSLGYEVTNFFFNEKLPAELDLVLAFGPFGSIVPIAKQILSFTVDRRPKLSIWMTEQFPHPSIPKGLLWPTSVMRSWLERIGYNENSQGTWTPRNFIGQLTRQGHRFRYFGDLIWLRNQKVLSVLAVGSKWIAGYLRKYGFNPLVAYIGSHPDWGYLLNIERTIPVLWLGKLGTDRRRHVLEKVRADLRKLGIDVLMIDGVEHPYVFGHERTVLLNKSKIAINVLREEWDNHSLRYFICAQNGVLVVTEPTLPHTPFIPGEHIISVSQESMAETINYYLNQESERKKIADRANKLVVDEITMENSIRNILQSAFLNDNLKSMSTEHMDN